MNKNVNSRIINYNNLPKHVGIIMDGNGRWASKRLMPRSFGHREGMKTVNKIVEFSADIGIKVLSLFAFSTENWKRPKEEVDNLMNLFNLYLKKERKKMVKNNIKFSIIGDISILSEENLKEISLTKKATEKSDGMTLNIAINYGSRSEIINATKCIADDFKQGKFDISDIDEKLFNSYLYTNEFSDVDLLIRPSGELRLSNFLMYQSSYAELWFSNILWPDFTEDDFMSAIIDYQSRDRRFGGVNE